MRDRLGWKVGEPGDGWARPKDMHRDTFERLCEEAERRERAADFAFILRAQEIVGGDLNDMMGLPRGTVEKYGVNQYGIAPRRSRRRRPKVAL